MIGFLYRIILALNATSWMIVIYGIKSNWLFVANSRLITSLLLLVIPILLSIISLFLSKWFSVSNDRMTNCKMIQLADNEFLPVYLGYFFVALSIPNLYTLWFVYCIVFCFSFLSQTQYFNPIFLLIGFHYYHIDTSKGTRIFVISHGKVIRSPEEINFERLKRVNDTTYIAVKEKENA